MLEQGTSASLLNGDLGMYKGAVYENIIADAFSKMDRPLYYYHKDSGLEIDFITSAFFLPVSFFHATNSSIILRLYITISS